MLINENTLIELGFMKIRANELIQSPFDFVPPKAQWAFHTVILNICEIDGKENYSFFDIESPNFKMGIQNDLHLKQIVYFISDGKKIADLFKIQQNAKHTMYERMQAFEINRPYLEDYRYNDIGGTCFEIGADPIQKVYMTYEKHSTSAYYYTLSDIASFEHAIDTIQTGPQTHSAISFWFLALESYINSIIKLCCIKKNERFEKFKKEDLHTRLGSLARLLELDMPTFYRNKIIRKINEFSYFRNELFHDRHFGDELNFKHTCFSPIPIFSCQVDTIQAILITIEVATMLRYVIEGLDTMPSVVLKNKDIAVWEKLDVAYEKIIRPWFSKALEKHKIRTRLDFTLGNTKSFYSSVFRKGDVTCMMRVDQEFEYEYWLNRETTNYGTDLYNQHLDSYSLAPGTMLINKVQLDK